MPRSPRPPTAPVSSAWLEVSVLPVNFHRYAVTQVMGFQLRVTDQPPVELA
jgi:hypothetical protein